ARPGSAAGCGCGAAPAAGPARGRRRGGSARAARRGAAPGPAPRRARRPSAGRCAAARRCGSGWARPAPPAARAPAQHPSLYIYMTTYVSGKPFVRGSSRLSIARRLDRHPAGCGQRPRPPHEEDAMRYALLLHYREPAEGEIPEEDIVAVQEAFGAYGRALESAGVLVAAEVLQPQAATT